MIQPFPIVRSTQAGDEQALPGSQSDPLPEEIERIPANDLISLYFRQIAAEPLLTPDQEIALGRQIERGHRAQQVLTTCSRLSETEAAVLRQTVAQGKAAHQHLTRANTRLVVPSQRLIAIAVSPWRI